MDDKEKANGAEGCDRCRATQDAKANLETYLDAASQNAPDERVRAEARAKALSVLGALMVGGPLKYS